MATVEKTRYQYLTELKDIVNEAAISETSKEGYINFLNSQIAILDRRREFDKKRVQQRQENTNAFCLRIYKMLPLSNHTIDEILLAVQESKPFKDQNVSRQKLAAALTKLTKAGLAVRTEVRINGNRRTAYRKAVNPDIVVNIEPEDEDEE